MSDAKTEGKERGLTAAQVQARLATEGPNELPHGQRRTPLRIALEVLREPMLAMLAMLLAAGTIYLLLGDTTEALILIAFAGLSIAIIIVQEARTERVLEALRDLSAPRALGRSRRTTARSERTRGGRIAVDGRVGACAQARVHAGRSRLGRARRG